MIKSLDLSVGRILKQLQESNIENNTLVIFMSDNGGIDKSITPKKEITSNKPFKGGKANLTEGGIRVPLIFRWKNKIKAGEWCHIPVDCSDLFPTIAEVAGHNLKKVENIDGQSLFKLLHDTRNKKESYKKNIHY